MTHAQSVIGENPIAMENENCTQIAKNIKVAKLLPNPAHEEKASKGSEPAFIGKIVTQTA